MRGLIWRSLAWLPVSVVATATPPAVRTDTQAHSAAGERNIARGAPYVMAPAPTYEHCTDPGDATQLTDGERTEGYFWTQKGTVGWQAVKYVTITIDLGRIEPIAGLSFRTAAGTAGVLWPALIRIHVSDDGRSYHDHGDLLNLLDAPRDLPTTYAVRRLATSRLKTRGRYVRLLVIPTGPYLFCDEIEVFRGDPAFLQLTTAGEPVVDVEESYLGYRVQAGIRRRFDLDGAGLERAIRDSTLSQSARQALSDRLITTQKDLAGAAPPAPLASFRAILPFNEAHAELFRIQAALWKATGCAALCAWAADPWEPLDLFAPPRCSSTDSMVVHLMRGEYRSAAFNMANTTDAPMRVSIRITGLPGSPTPAFITLHRVPWTDTITGQAVAAALVEVASRDGAWTLDVPPGLLQQIFLTCRVTDLPAGEHAGRIVVTSKGIDDLAIPIRLHVYPLTFPTRTTLWLGGWSYTDGPGTYGITPANHKPFVEHLRSRFVNAPWATAQVMMSFSFKGEVPELDTARFDDWLAQWPDARAYLVFLAVDRTFAGAQMGTPAFEQRVGRWISAWVRHLAGKGVSAERLGLLLVDEPRSRDQDEIIIAWARAIHAAEPKVLIWEDPIYPDPKEGRPEMFELSDILCPNRPMWLTAGKPFEQFYLDQQKKGRTLQLYSCSGPARLLDPYSYFRLQAWHCWRIGATGTFFWAFGDNSRASSWNEYAAVAGPYTPLFLDHQSVTPGKHMEAVRESIEDYECLALLRSAVNQALASGRSGPAVTAAQSLLEQGVNDVLDAPGVNDLGWHSPKDRTRADAVRAAVLQALSSRG